MARKIAVEIVGDSRSLERAFGRSAKSATVFTRNIEKAGRGAAAGSGLFRGMGRSIAFASGGFLAFASVTDFLRDSVDAAREAAVSQRALGAQMKANGESFKDNRQQVEQVSRSYAKFGFQNDEVIQSLTVLDRGTGSISEALKLEGLAADLARAKNIDLSAAAQTVAKVFGGQETALRRAVPGLRKSAHGYDLIREAQRKLAGQALANTTSAERFNASLHDTEEIIGTALLPVLNKYLDALSEWLNKSENQKKLQEGAHKAAKDTGNVLNFIGKGLKVGKRAWDDYNSAVDKAARGAGPLKPLSEGIKVLYKPAYGITKLAQALDKLTHSADKAHGSLANLGRPMAALGAGIPGFGLPAAGAAGAAAPAAVNRRLGFQSFLNVINRQLTRSQYGDLQQQLTVLQQVATLLERRISITKKIGQRQKLADQLLETQYQARQIRLQIRQERAAAAEQRAQAIEQGAQSKQFRLLGLGPTGEALVPGVRALQRQLSSVQERILGTALDTRKREGLLANLRKILAGGLGTVGSEVRQKIAEILADIDRQLKQHSQKTETGFHKTSAAAILAGLGLTPRQRKALGVRLATLGPGGGVPGAPGQLTGGIVVYGGVHVHGVQDAKRLEEELMKRRRQRAHRRRGSG